MKYPTKYRRYPFKRQLKRKLKKIAFMIIIAALLGGGRYYGKYYNNTERLNKSHDTATTPLEKQTD
jgi:hypothetical protein